MSDAVHHHAAAPVDDLDVDAVAAFLATEMDHPPSNALRAEPLTGGRSNPTYTLTDGRSSWVLRRPPYDTHVGSAHDMTREATAMTALSASRVPVPRVVARCDDPAVIGAPFYVMDQLVGRTFRSPADTVGLTPPARAAISAHMVETLANLHAVDPVEIGLAGWGRPDGYLERQLDRWRRQWDAVAISARPQVDHLFRWLLASVPASGPPGIVHGDYKLDNVMFDVDADTSSEKPASVVAVLDWELSTLGDTLTDLGYLVSCWDEPGVPAHPLTQGATALPGFATADELVHLYCLHRNVRVDDLAWYVVLADLKLAVILEQIHRRKRDASSNDADEVGAMVEPLLDRALDRTARSSVPGLRSS